MRKFTFVLTISAAALALTLGAKASSNRENAPQPISIAVRQATSARDGAPPSAPSMTHPQETPQRIIAYTLPLDLYRKAHTLSRISFWGQIVTLAYSLAIFLVILKWRLGPRYREWAEKSVRARILQPAIFGPLFLLTIAIFQIPIDIAQEWVLRKFGLSVQSWGSWSWDWTKGQFLSICLGTFLIWILYSAIRKSPRRWWFYFWLISLPIGIFLVFVQPLVVDPLFHKFEPLARKDPSLTVSLEHMVQRAGENIPPDRMFWMGAAEKSTALNAYVTGIGASKRIVVWDTTISKMTTPEIVFVAGHEMGHYVLLHIWKGMAADSVLMFVLFYLGFHFAGVALARWGDQWKIRGMDDYASLPVLLLVLTIFGFAASPLTSGFSRHIEHQADQYGLEVTHGLTPDASQVAARSFQKLGEVDLDDPDPNRAAVFLFYDHPPITDRVRFILAYDPWSKGGQGQFVH